MRASMKVAKLDFFTMKSQLFSYLSLAAIVLMFGFLCYCVMYYGRMVRSIAGFQHFCHTGKKQP